MAFHKIALFLSRETHKRFYKKISFLFGHASYNTGVWPEDVLRSVIVSLKKKTGARSCEDHHTISLISHTSKVILKILAKRMENKIFSVIGDDQFGFIKSRGTREATAIMRLLSERSIEHNNNICIAFIDFEKAFDRVD